MTSTISNDMFSEFLWKRSYIILPIIKSTGVYFSRTVFWEIILWTTYLLIVLECNIAFIEVQNQFLNIFRRLRFSWTISRGTKMFTKSIKVWIFLRWIKFRIWIFACNVDWLCQKECNKMIFSVTNSKSMTIPHKMKIELILFFENWVKDHCFNFLVLEIVSGCTFLFSVSLMYSTLFSDFSSAENNFFEFAWINSGTISSSIQNLLSTHMAVFWMIIFVQKCGQIGRHSKNLSLPA